MTAELFTPGLESASKALKYRRWLGYRKLLYTPGIASEQKEFEKEAVPGITMTEIREKLALGARLNASENMLLHALKSKK